jgi:hypothetical protein
MWLMFVEKYNKHCVFWDRLVQKDPRAEKTVRSYCGFEGMCSFAQKIETERSAENQLSSLRKQMGRSNTDRPVVVLRDIEETADSSFGAIDGVIARGYDYGMVRDETNLYSSLFNEVLFGAIPQLLSFRNSLIDCLLFPNPKVAAQYATIHRDLLLQGSDVEVDDDMTIYEVLRAAPHR